MHCPGVRHGNFCDVGNGPGENPQHEGKPDNVWYRKKDTKVGVLEQRGAQPRHSHTHSDLETKPRVKHGGFLPQRLGGKWHCKWALHRALPNPGQEEEITVLSPVTRLGIKLTRHHVLCCLHPDLLLYLIHVVKERWTHMLRFFIFLFTSLSLVRDPGWETGVLRQRYLLWVYVDLCMVPSD